MLSPSQSPLSRGWHTTSLCSVTGDANFGHLVQMAAAGPLHCSYQFPLMFNKYFLGIYYIDIFLGMKHLFTSFSIH